jgi:DNA replication protein
MMQKFQGFSDSDTATPIRDSFFNELLGAIGHGPELKIVLYSLWRVEHMQGTYRALSEADFGSEALGLDISEIKSGLDKAVERGVLVHSAHGDQSLYFLNSPRGRAAAQAFAERGLDEAGSTASLPLERPNLFRLYEENMGPLTPLIADALKDAEKSYAAEWIAEAIELAVKHNKRSWRYCEAILRRWKEEGRGQEPHRRDDQAARQRQVEEQIRRFLEG